jgi:signal transduction histidine kinase/CheY-like chemotaxis protein
MGLFLITPCYARPEDGEKVFQHETKGIDSQLGKARSLVNTYPDSAGKLALEGLKLIKDQQPSRPKAELYETLGLAAQHKEEYSIALEYYNKAHTIFRRLLEDEESQRITLRIAQVYNLLVQIGKATQLNFTVLSWADSLEKKDIQARAHYNLGELYRLQHDGALAAAHLEQAYMLTDSIVNADFHYGVLHNLALAHDINGDAKTAIEQLKHCLLYATTLQPNDSARIFNNIGRIYRMQGDFDHAESFLKKSLDIRSKLDNPPGLGHTYNELGTLQIDVGNYQLAKKYLLKAYEIAEHTGKVSLLLDICRNLSNACYFSGEFEKALEYEKQYGNYRFQQYSEQKAATLSEWQTMYETEKKEQENEFLKKESATRQLIIRRQRWVGFLIISLLLVVSVSAFLAYRASVTRKKLLLHIEKQNEVLSRDKDIIEAQAEKMRALDRMKSMFFTNISHEFRTPLTLILGPLERGISEGKPPDDKEMEIMHKHADQLLKLINQLLDLSKLEAGELKLNAEGTEFVAYLKGFVMSFSSLAEIQQKSLHFESTIAGLQISIDREKMDKILYNLLSNAFKFTEQNNEIRVTLNRKDEQYLEIRIKDTGSGIPTEDLPHIFDRFYQSGDNHNLPGTGIGLALANELTILHGGNISAESIIGSGTTFKILLPVINTSGNKIPIEGTPPEAITVDSGNSLATYPLTPGEIKPAEDLQFDANDEIVLIVEDNPDVRQFIKNSLPREFKVVEAEHGKEGLEKADKYIPDLIISDVMMPVMDGIEFVEQIKKGLKTSHIPVILLTAKESTDNRIEGLQTGADDYLSKPFVARELNVRIRNLISQRKQLRKLFGQHLLAEPREQADALSPQDRKFLSMCRKAVLVNLSDEYFDVEHMSQNLAISRSNLFRKLRALTDKSPSAYIRTIRLEKAAELLKTENLRINEIAYRVGFSNVSYFNKCFKELFGSAPSEFPFPAD